MTSSLHGSTSTPAQGNQAPWQALLARDSFIELDGRGRALALLDAGTHRELCGPFDGVESPWLESQGIVPQSDDGLIVVKGKIFGLPSVVISIEQAFAGGAIGEVSGAKMTTALAMAAAQERGGPLPAVLLLESGGVRLQEANLGLAAIAEICAALLELRRLKPVVGVIAGPLGCFGGMGIVAGLCTHLIMTAEARLSLNGPEVIESEAGIYEIDSTDRSAIWAATGGRARVAAGLADRLVLDDVGAMRAAVAEALKVHPTNSHRSQRLTTTRQWIETNTPTHQALKTDRKVPTSTPERGTIWTEALTEVDLMRPCPSVLRGELRLDVREAVILSIAVDPESRYHRAAHGELGLREGLVLAEQIIQVVKTDQSLRPTEKRPIIAIVDVPSQAYGWIEETTGLHHVLACAVDAYATARMAGHPIIALVVGQAISGGFLAHGFQANQILALDDPGVQIHAMHQAAAARITRRSLESLEILERTVLPMSRRVSDWAKLGLCDQLISINDPDAPTASDLTMVRSALTLAVDRARMEPLDLSNRRIFTGNSTTRRATQEVMARMAAQW